MIAAGMNSKKITEFIGHSDVRTTYNRYGKVVPEDLAPPRRRSSRSTSSGAARGSKLALALGARLVGAR